MHNSRKLGDREEENKTMAKEKMNNIIQCNK